VILQGIHGLEYAVVEPFFPEIVPEMFHGIKFWCVRREREKSHIFGNLKESCGMPSCTVKNHNNPVFGMARCNFVEKHLHAIAVYVRKDETVELSVDNRNSAIGVGIFLRHHGLAERAMWLRAPTPSGIRDAAKTGFVFKHYSERSFPFFLNVGDEVGEFFFHSS
jgi:hypothetical protein